MLTPIGWGRTASSLARPLPTKPQRPHDISPINPFGFSWQLAVSL
jgi:hypothetical protein